MNSQSLFNWILSIPNNLSPFIQWLVEPIKYLDIPPIALLSIGGFVTIFVFHVIHLVNVVSG